MDLNSFILKSREILFLSSVFPVEINKNEAFRFYSGHINSIESVEKIAQIYCAELKRREEVARKRKNQSIEERNTELEIINSFKTLEVIAYNEDFLDVDKDAVLFVRINKAQNETVSFFVTKSLKNKEDYFIQLLSEKIEYILGNDSLKKVSVLLDLEDSNLLGDLSNNQVFERFLSKSINVLCKQNPERYVILRINK